MKKVRRIGPIVLFLIFNLSAYPAFGAKICVDDDNPCPGSGTPEDPFCAIQYGIDAAFPGDLVLVAPGTYVENIDFPFEKDIIVRSDVDCDPATEDISPETTIIDGDQAGSVVTFASGETEASVLDGFTIQNGKGTVDGDFTYGGGIYCSSSSPTIMNCTISANSTGYGGGIYCENGSSPTITNCTISGNRTDTGGGIYCTDSFPTITNCTISENFSDYGGGGIYCTDSSPTIANCTISENSVELIGGGILCTKYSSPIIANCTITANTVSSGGGGGIYCYQFSDPEITNCTISENSAGEGGGIYCYEHSSPIITNCTIEENFAGYGGGIFCGSLSDPLITHCTIIRNTSITGGGGIRCIKYSSPTITNCILWQNLYSEIWMDCSSFSSTLTVNYSDVQGGEDAVHVDPGCTLNWGPGNIDLDPLFVDPVGSDYHISDASPCIDAGTDAGVYDDIDGDERSQGCGFDMGADENVNCRDCDGDHYPEMGCGGDCDDSNPYISPGAEEVCDATDWDCSGDHLDKDIDGDGYIDDDPVCMGDDCDDTDPGINPGAAEVCYNGIDDDCDGLIDEDCYYCTDLDGDGYGDPASSDCVFPQWDCDDTDPYINPGQSEVSIYCVDGKDNDCDGLIDWYDDQDCPAEFTLELDASYEAGTLQLDFNLGASEPVIWDIFLILTSPTIQVIPLLTVPLPPIAAPIYTQISFPFPSVGWVMIYSGLFTFGGLQADGVAWVGTGS